MSAQITTAMSQSVENPSRETTTPVAAAMWIKAMSVATLLPLLGLVGGMFVWRRLAGALHEPLDPWTLAITAVVLATASVAVRVLGGGYRGPDAWSRPCLLAAVLFGPTAAITAAGFAISVPGTSGAGLTAIWGILAVGELSGLILGISAASGGARLTNHAWQLVGMFKSLTNGRAIARRLRIDASHTPAPHAIEQAPLQTETGSADTGLDSATLDESPDGFKETPGGTVTQQVIRQLASDGTETMSGWLRASFEPGQRTASVHLAFCPPFSSMPTVEVEQVDGPPGRIKTVQLLPYGARFDLKLLKDAEEQLSVLMRFSARA